MYSNFLFNAKKHIKKLKFAEFYQANLLLEIAQISGNKKDLNLAREMGLTCIDSWKSAFFLEVYKFSKDILDLELAIKVAKETNNYYILSLCYLELSKKSQNKEDFDLSVNYAEKIIDNISSSSVYLELARVSRSNKYFDIAKDLIYEISDFHKFRKLFEIYKYSLNKKDLEMFFDYIKEKDFDLFDGDILLDLSGYIDSSTKSLYLDFLNTIKDNFLKCKIYLKLFNIEDNKDYLDSINTILEKLTLDVFLKPFPNELKEVLENEYFYEMSSIYLGLYENSHNDLHLEKSKEYLESISYPYEKCKIYLEYAKAFYTQSQDYINLICDIINNVESDYTKAELYIDLAKLQIIYPNSSNAKKNI